MSQYNDFRAPQVQQDAIKEIKLGMEEGIGSHNAGLIDKKPENTLTEYGVAKAVALGTIAAKHALDKEKEGGFGR